VAWSVFLSFGRRSPRRAVAQRKGCSDMKTSETRTRRLTGTLLAGTSALLVVVGLSLLISRFHALAQPAAEVASLVVTKTANTDVAEPGDRLTYTITIEESAPLYYATLLMTDTLPSAVTYVPDSLQRSGPGTANFSGGVITWNASTFGNDAHTVITFSVQIPPDITVPQIENTVQVTGTGQLMTVSRRTTILTGALPGSQIRSPDRDAVITQKGTLAIRGIAWLGGTVPPYLVEDPVLSVQKVSDRIYYVSWTAVVSAEHYLLQEATKPDFSVKEETVVVASTTNQLISIPTGEDGTYYYRVQAFRLGLNPSRWSNVESVVVPWMAASASLPVPTLSADLATNGPITVQVSIDDRDWDTAIVTATDWGGWDWTYDWDLPQENDVQHAIHSQASDAAGNLGPIDTITVTLRNRNYMAYFPLIFKRWPPICYPPTLNAITDPEGDGAYAVLWSYPYPSTYPQPINYTLQEATNASFTTGVQSYSPGNTTSQAISGKAPGTYYYRVQGNNTYGPGEWSNVQSVTVVPPYYFDDFSNPNSGWPQVSKTVIPETASRYRLLYENGRYRIMIDAGGPPIWFHHPDALAPYRPPTDKYCVETSVKLERGKAPYQNWNYYPYWANGGLVFGATEDNKGIYAVCLTVGGGDTMGWFITSNPVYSYPRVGCAYQGENGGGPRGGEPAGVLSISEWHRIKVGVDGNRAAVYINGVYKGSWGMSGLSGTTRVGLIGGDYEVTPVDFRFDDFKVIPNAACTP